MRKKRLRIIIFVMVVIMLVGQMSGCTADQKSSSKEQKENLGKKPKKKNIKLRKTWCSLQAIIYGKSVKKV